VVDYKVIDFHVHLPWKEKKPKMAAKALIEIMKRANIEKAVVIAIEPSEKKFDSKVSPDSIIEAAGESLDLIAFSRCERIKKTIYNPEKTIKEHKDLLRIHKRTTEEVIEATEPYKDKLLPVASFNPDLGIEGNISRLKKVKDKIIGVKLYPTLHFIKPNAQCLEPLYSFLEEEGLVLIVHTGCDPGIWEIPSFCETARPKYLMDVAKRHKNLTIIIAHLGSYSALQEGIFIHEALELISKYENVYGDTSAISSYYVKLAVNEVGSDRILFGSDYPYVIGRTPCDAIKDIKSLDISEKDKRAILYDNAARLLSKILRRVE
jgi:predicted TIM-barrel fold metal-dependent hydrolase